MQVVTSVNRINRKQSRIMALWWISKWLRAEYVTTHIGVHVYTFCSSKSASSIKCQTDTLFAGGAHCYRLLFYVVVVVKWWRIKFLKAIHEDSWCYFGSWLSFRNSGYISLSKWLIVLKKSEWLFELLLLLLFLTSCWSIIITFAWWW